MSTTSRLPTVFIIIGVTGDLASKKLLPALFNLWHDKALPEQFHVLGFSRRAWSDNDLKQHVHDVVARHHLHEETPRSLAAFLDCFSYQPGTFNEPEGWHDLAARLKKLGGKTGLNTLIHLAAAPEHYPTILRQLSDSGLSAPTAEIGWTRLLLEKPFGHNLSSVQHLEQQLKLQFNEQQIYRIDHYLAKDVVQNILSFRFSNDIFEQVWNNRSIQRIDIRQWETIGVDARGAYYDRTGAFTDVGQNHLLQLLALTTMGNPGALTAEAIRSARTLPLTSLLPLSPAQLKTNTFRSQYKGYRTIEGVTPDSTTETFFRINCALSQSQWSGVPITLEHGKRLGERRKEIVITFRHETPCLCPAGAHLTNKVTFSLEPYEGIRIQFWSKKPGHTYDVERSNLEFSLREVASGHTQYVKEYTKLLHDAIVGDQTLFLTATEVEAMWRFTEPVVQAWRANLVPLNFYAPDTNEAPLQAQQLEPNRVRGLGGAPHARQLGLVGLGKMGGNIAQRLHELSWEVHAYNRTQAVTETFTRAGLLGAATLKELAASLTPPRVVWLALPAGPAVDDLLFGSTGLGQHLGSGDIVIEAGNSFYKDTIERHRKLAESGISLVDVGVSGGPSGARSGPTLMVGGEKEVVERLEPLFVELASPGGYQFFAGPGAGHFVKMVHNGIEYGMMQALAEGFTILKQASYQLDLTRVADIYNHGSVIESRLTDWLKQALSLHGPALPNITATVAHTGEAAWTVQTAQEMDIPAQIITEALEFRKQSEHNPSYTGKILSALRQQFGGHQAVETKEQPK